MATVSNPDEFSIDPDDLKELQDLVDSYFYEDATVEVVRIIEKIDLVAEHLRKCFNFDANSDAVDLGLVEIDEDAVIENYEAEYPHVVLEHTYNYNCFVVREVL